MVLSGPLTRTLLTALGLITMRTLHVITALAFASLTASAFAGPDWDVIQRARQASHSKPSATHEVAVDQRSMEEACQEMMKQMPMDQVHGEQSGMGAMMAAPQLAAAPMGAGMAGAAPAAEFARTSARAALFGARASDATTTRTVVIQPGMEAIPVEAGESVRFAFGPTSAAWTFASRPGDTAVDLGLLFPDIPAAQGVWAYPNGSRLYSGH